MGDSGPGSRVLVWDDRTREEFMAWSERVAGYSEEHRRSLIRYLDRYLAGREVRSAEDIRAILMACERGRRHLQLALKNLFKFLEWKCWPENLLTRWHKLVKVEKTAKDCDVPSEDDIIKSLRVLAEGRADYWVLYKVLLDSGMRIRHAVEFLNTWDGSKLKEHDGYYIYILGKTDGLKKQPYVFLTPYTVQLIRKLKASRKLTTIGENAAKVYYRKRAKKGVVLAKYVRLWMGY